MAWREKGRERVWFDDEKVRVSESSENREVWNRSSEALGGTPGFIARERLGKEAYLAQLGVGGLYIWKRKCGIGVARNPA